MGKVKYSVVLPTLNSIQYLPTCVETIISQDYSDYELIISNNCSDDGTAEYLETLRSNPQVKIIRPEKRLPLGEHWDFAVSHAQGEWVYGIGSDDGVLPYFFKLLDILTDIADKKNLNIIKTNRVYYFWDGVQDVYGNAYINYYARPHIEIKSTKKILYEVLYENPDKFFDIPQMYTTALFRDTVLGKIKHSKNNRIIQQGISQDIYLGLLGGIVEEYYLYTDIPIGWVGSSVKSYGLKESKTIPNFETLKKEVQTNPEKYCGKFINHHSILPFGNSYLEYAIWIFLKNKDGYDVSLPSDLDILQYENQVKFYACSYKKIMEIQDKTVRQQRLFFLNVMLDYNGIKNTDVIAAYKRMTSTTSKNHILVKKIKGIFGRMIKKLFLKNTIDTVMSMKIYQCYGDANIFKDMLAVNEAIKNAPEIHAMIASLAVN